MYRSNLDLRITDPRARAIFEGALRKPLVGYPALVQHTGTEARTGVDVDTERRAVARVGAYHVEMNTPHGNEISSTKFADCALIESRTCEGVQIKNG